MKTIIFILLTLPIIIISQHTYVPDDNFEAYLEANGMGDGIANNDSVLTGNIISVDSLNIGYNYISDLTGIEDFNTLTILIADSNQITSLDLSNNLALEYLSIPMCQLTTLDLSQNINIDVLITYGLSNQFSSLDLSNNTSLSTLECSSNSITSLNLNNNIYLSYLGCANNQISSLDLSNNTNLESLFCHFNPQLSCLNLKNGNNNNITNGNILLYNNPSLTCIEVDDSIYSTNTWTNIDIGLNFSLNCNYPLGCFSTNPTSINEYSNVTKVYPNPSKNKITIELTNSELLNYNLIIYDNLGRKVHGLNFIIDEKIEIDLRDFKNGIYHYTLFFPTQNLRSTGKFIKN